MIAGCDNNMFSSHDSKSNINPLGIWEIPQVAGMKNWFKLIFIYLKVFQIVIMGAFKYTTLDVLSFHYC